MSQHRPTPHSVRYKSCQFCLPKIHPSCPVVWAWSLALKVLFGRPASRLAHSNSSSLWLPEIYAYLITFSSVQFSRSVVFDSLRPHESQHARPPCPSPTPEFTQTHIHRVSDAIQPSHSLSFPSSSAPIPPSIRVFSNESTLHEVAKVLEFQP